MRMAPQQVSTPIPTAAIATSPTSTTTDYRGSSCRCPIVAAAQAKSANLNQPNEARHHLTVRYPELGGTPHGDALPRDQRCQSP